MQSNLSSNVTKLNFNSSPILDTAEAEAHHVAIIMDGNGRWAQQRGLPRLYGHKAGVEAVRKIIQKSPELGIGMLTLYAFSSDNWKRPKEEVTHLFSLLGKYLKAEIAGFIRNGIRLIFIGRRDRITSELRNQIEAAEWDSRHGTTLTVRIALDYSARDQIISALNGQINPTAESISRALSGIGEDWPVDLLIRTSGEQRLSDFLLWECAYAEFYFTHTHWPDFDANALTDAVRSLNQRERRYGGVNSQSV